MKKRCNLLRLLLLVIWCAPAWSADEDIARFQAQIESIKFPAGVSVTVDSDSFVEGTASLKVEYTGAESVSVPLIKILNPGAPGSTLLYKAQLRGENLQGPAYLEMWCGLNGGEYFSRALPQAITGTTDWQKAQAPFMLEPDQQAKHARLGVRMEGPGTVWIDGIQLSHHSKWTPENTASGTVWGVVGTVLGVASGLWGLLTSVLVRRGIGRRFLMGYGIVLWGIGVGMLVRGGMLAVDGHAFIHWFPWLQCGGIFVVLFSVLLPLIQYRYRQAEEHRMAMMDLSDSV